jgi:transposase
VIDVTEILVHWHAGRSKNEMAQNLGVDRKTLRKYIGRRRRRASSRRAGQERAGVGGSGAGLVPAVG